MSAIRNSLVTASFMLLNGVLSVSTSLAQGATQLPPRPGRYNYVPTTIRTGSDLQIWWCGGDPNSGSDHIYYRHINVDAQVYDPIIDVLQPTGGTWDSIHTCDPSVVRGQWQFPPNSGTTYSYAMYYTGTDDIGNPSAGQNGVNNGLGVAYSNDGINWVKYPYPIFRNPSTTPASYGVGEASVYSADGQSALWMFILQAPPPGGTGQSYGLYYSDDGLHLGSRGTVSTKGVIGSFISEADFAYDYNTQNMYMVTSRINDQSQLDIYRIKFNDILNGTWSQIGNINRSYTNNNTFNGGGGFLRNEFGNNTPFLPTLGVYFGSGDVNTPDTWQLWSYVQQAP